MTRREEALVEQVTTAFRARDPDGAIRTAPAWHDLSASGREAAFRATVALRRLEAALDPEGLSTTARAVLARVKGGRGRA